MWFIFFTKQPLNPKLYKYNIPEKIIFSFTKTCSLKKINLNHLLKISTVLKIT